MRRSAVLAVLLVLAAGSAEATVSNGDGLIWFNLGYSTGEAAYSGKSIDGGIATFVYERLDWQSPVSVGISVGYGEVSDESTEGNRRTNTTIATVPIYVGGKYWLGQGRAQGYLGAALGIYFSRLRATVIETGAEFSSLGYAGGGLGVPVGVAIGLGDTTFLNLNYTLNWMWSNDAFDNDLLHALSVGLGFNLGP